MVKTRDLIDPAKLAELQAEGKCQYGYRCLDMELEQVCKAEDIQVDNWLQCLDPKAKECNYCTHLMEKHLCRCPIRFLIAKYQTGKNKDKDN